MLLKSLLSFASPLAVLGAAFDARVDSSVFTNSRWTYYNVGLGVCGTVSQNTDFVVALNAAQFDSGSHCFKTINMTYMGTTAQAQIVGRCPSCASGNLDLSPGLFSFFAPLAEGLIFGEWTFA